MRMPAVCAVEDCLTSPLDLPKHGLNPVAEGKCTRRYAGAGAVWDIWPREAAATLRAYLAEHCAEFVHNGKRLEPADVQDWIVSQACSSGGSSANIVCANCVAI